MVAAVGLPLGLAAVFRALVDKNAPGSSVGESILEWLQLRSWQEWSIFSLAIMVITTVLYAADRILRAEADSRSAVPEIVPTLRSLSVDFGDGVPVDGYAIFADYGRLLESTTQGADWINKVRSELAIRRTLADDYRQRADPVLSEILRVLELHNWTRTDDSDQTLPDFRRYALTPAGRDGQRCAETVSLEGIARKLRAQPVRWLKNPRANLLEIAKYLGPLALEWTTTRKLGDGFCPRNRDGTIAGEWLADGHGSAHNAAQEFCNEMHKRGLMAKTTHPETLHESGMVIPAPCDYYQWNDKGRALYEYVVNDNK